MGMKVIEIVHVGTQGACKFYIPADPELAVGGIISIMQPVTCPLCGEEVTGDFFVTELDLYELLERGEFNWLAFA